MKAGRRKSIGALLLYQVSPLKKTVFAKKFENSNFLSFFAENLTTISENRASKISLLYK